MFDSHREDAHAGEMYTENGSLRFSESFDGEYFHFDMYDSILNETKRIMMTPSEIYAIAKAGVLTECIDVSVLEEECGEIHNNMRKRQIDLQEIRSRYEYSMPIDLEEDYDAAHLDLSGGDGTPEYYAVEGWGTIRLDNGDFEVSYKV